MIVTIELTILISGVSVAFAVYFGIVNVRRNRTVDERDRTADECKDVSQMTTVIVKLENIGTTTTEIKCDLNTLKNDLRATSERLVRVEESTKSAHKRLDAIDERLLKYGVPGHPERE